MACPDIGTGAAANVLTSLLKKVVQEVKMIISLPQAFSDIEDEVQRLNNLIRDIKVELARVDMNPKSIVKAWLDKADEAIESSRSIRSDFEQHKNYLSCCPNCLCRYRIGKHIRDWKDNVVRLHSQRQSDFPPSGEYGDPTPRTQVPIQNPESAFVSNTLRSAQMEVVETWLTDKDSNIRRIALHGMGGVGKTLLLDTINDSEKVRNSFELIIKVTVSKNDILDLQNCVADRLSLTLPHTSNVEGRTGRLRSHLKNKKYLLLLDDMWADDMWTSDELQKLGVSLNDTGFKIVLTTRDKEVCTRMNVQETIIVEPLLEDEGWELFRSRAFENLNGNAPPELEEVAREIAKECKGLPLAIIVVAAAMTHHSAPYEWKVALDQMKNVHETFYDLHAGVDKKLFQRLKWSYDVLPNYLKTCFLYFAAYPEDEVIEVEEVIDMWVAEGLVQGSGETYLHDIGHNYIKHLKDRCLIEVVRNDSVGRVESVKIHDVLRDLAIRIAKKEHGCIFKAGQGLSHFPVEEVDDKACERMSLMYNHLPSLPTTFACSSLSVLLLGKSRGIKEVPESFLRELSSLKVLDLHDTSIMSLPPCIGNLKHLASLQLSYCRNIRELPETICDLKELQFLDVSHCNQLRCLPERISELKSLRALDLPFCEKLSHIPRGISELVTLERLPMFGSIGLDFEEEANAEERKYGCLKDLQSLQRLRVLHVRMKSPVKEGVMGNWSKMRDLLLDCRDANQDYLPQDMQAMKDLESLYIWWCHVERLPNWVSEFRKLAYLDLSYCKQLKELPAELPCLRELRIDSCNKLEELELGMGFPKLERLTLMDLKSLECVGAVAAASGSGGLGEGASPLPPMLKSLRVTQCPKLKRLRGDKLKCLEVIRGSREWWDAIQWEDPNMKASLQSKFRSVRVNSECIYVVWNRVYCMALYVVWNIYWCCEEIRGSRE